jgi:glucokinase
MIEKAAAIAIDLGGTRSRVAAVAVDGTVLIRREQPTEADAGPDVVIANLARAVIAMRVELSQPPVGLGVAAPGPIEHRTGVILQAPNLGWKKPVAMVAALQDATGLATFLGNDANLAALGEARFGAGRGARNLIYLTISTGIGSGIITNGILLLGEHGAAGEAGHTTIYKDGRDCHCGNQGCLEAYASGTALVERATEAMAAGRASRLAEYDGHFEAPQVADAAAAGDGLALELIDEAGAAMGIGIRNLLHLFDPELIVIGGGVSNIGARFWDPMMEVVQADCYAAYGRRAKIIPAALGDDQGLMGAAAWVHEQVRGVVR